MSGAAENLAEATPTTAGSADRLCDLAVAQHRAGDSALAVETCLAALAIEPDHGAVHLNLSCILRELDRPEDAVGHADRAEAVALGFGDEALAIDARFNRGQALLGLGHTEQGWHDWDARLALPLWRRFDPARCWDGAPLAGRTLVVRREQGLGDELFFAACYAALLRQAEGPSGGSVVIECDARLRPAFERALPGARFHAIDTVAGRAAAMAGQPTPPGAQRAPAADLWIAAGSLPRLVGFPAQGQAGTRLAPTPEDAREWHARIAALPGEGPVIGLCWRSSQQAARRDRFQASIDQLDPLLALPGLRVVSLQLGVTEDEQAHVHAIRGHRLETFADLDLANDIERSMALLAAIDHMVSVGTWVVPLAGLVGTAASYLSGIRDYWALGTDTIPWFGGMRVHRAVDGDFADAARRVAATLAGGAWR